MRRLTILVIATLVACLILGSGHFEPDIAKGLAVLVFIAILWLTEAFHVTATALLVPILATALGILSVSDALKNFANPIIYLFLGGFALAAALRSQKIDQWLAASVVRLAGGNLKLAILYLFLSTAFISMWISNTATTAMMLPVVLGLMSSIDRVRHETLFVFVLLGVAYSANIGGIGTLVGSPPNAIAASVLNMDFASWMKFGLPSVVILLPLMIGVLWFLLRPEYPAKQTAAATRQVPVIQWWGKPLAVLLVFACVVGLWLFSSPVSGLVGIEKDFDSIVALGAVVVLLASGLLEWKEFERSTDWGVLLLFGGGITLSAVLSETTASRYLADQLVAWLEQVPAWVFLAMAVGLMVFLTELASNTASAALLVPIFYSLPAEQTGLPPELLAIGVAIAASCAFMLPVATPPNALVFGTGMVRQQQMVRAGLVLNLLCILTITLLILLLGY